MSLLIFFVEKPLVIGYKVKVCVLYVFLNVSSYIHYLRMSSDTEHKEFTCMDSQMFLQIFVIWENIWTLVTRLRFITCMCSQISLQISIIWECLRTKSARVLFRMCMYFERSLQICIIYEKLRTLTASVYFFTCIYSQLALQITTPLCIFKCLFKSLLS